MQTTNKRKFNGKKPTWDVVEGKRLYDEGLLISEIARRLGVKYINVYDYAARHWTPAAVAEYHKDDI